MFCPKCRAEFREGFTKCPDCKIELVHERPKAKGKKSEFVDFEELITTTDLGKIAFIKSLLEDQQIHYFAQGDSITPLHVIFPIKILVPKNQIEKAKELLKDL